jgi:transcriptional regulator with XRE-family HTH domain
VPHFAKNFKYLLQKLSLSQASIEPVVDKRQTTISNWLNGKSSPDAGDLVKLSHFFLISMDDLCLMDLSNGNLIDEEYVSRFRQKGNPNGNQNGNLMSEFHHFSGNPSLAVNSKKELEETNLWIVMNALKAIDQKLDEIRLSLKKE